MKGEIKVYIAGSFAGRKRIALEAAWLENFGFEVLSKWFDEVFFLEKAWDQNFGGDVAKTMAQVDFTQILQADLLILDTVDKSSTGGSDTELGMALIREYERKIRIVHIGPYRNIFQTLVREHYESWALFINSLDCYK